MNESVQDRGEARERTGDGAGLLYWLPSIAFLLHTLEELPGFASWVSRHFGALSTETFVLSHIPMIWLVLLVSYKATRRPARSGWALLAVAWQWQFGVNAVFHLSTAALFREYSPGMLTAGTVFLPFTAYVVGRTLREQRLSRGQLGLSFVIGLVVAALAIGSLFMHPRAPST